MSTASNVFSQNVMVAFKQQQQYQFSICTYLNFLNVEKSIIIIIYNPYGGKAPVTRSDFQGGPIKVKIKIH